MANKGQFIDFLIDTTQLLLQNSDYAAMDITAFERLIDLSDGPDEYEEELDGEDVPSFGSTKSESKSHDALICSGCGKNPHPRRRWIICADGTWMNADGAIGRFMKKIWF